MTSELPSSRPVPAAGEREEAWVPGAAIPPLYSPRGPRPAPAVPVGVQPTASSDLDQAHDWLIQWAMAQSPDVVSHYWHMSDGQHWTCGCPLEGEEDPR